MKHFRLQNLLLFPVMAGLAQAAPAVDASLTQRLLSEDVAVSSAALDQIDPLSPGQKRQLTRELGQSLSQNPATARKAAVALARLGPWAEGAVLNLVEALRDD